VAFQNRRSGTRRSRLLLSGPNSRSILSRPGLSTRRYGSLLRARPMRRRPSSRSGSVPTMADCRLTLVKSSRERSSPARQRIGRQRAVPRHRSSEGAISVVQAGATPDAQSPTANQARTLIPRVSTRPPAAICHDLRPRHMQRARNSHRARCPRHQPVKQYFHAKQRGRPPLQSRRHQVIVSSSTHCMGPQQRGRSVRLLPAEKARNRWLT
jgi:hypothetical protein